MLRFLRGILFICVVEADCWRPLTINAKRSYLINNEGQTFKPLYSENEEKINCDLLIDGDTTKLIKMGYSYPFPNGDTVRIDLFDNETSYANSFSIIILKGQYLIRYHREIIGTDLVQKFEPLKSKLELNSSDFWNGNTIRGHVEYTGKCVNGCSNKNMKIRIEGNFAVKIHRY